MHLQPMVFPWGSPTRSGMLSVNKAISKWNQMERNMIRLSCFTKRNEDQKCVSMVVLRDYIFIEIIHRNSFKHKWTPMPFYRHWQNENAFVKNINVYMLVPRLNLKLDKQQWKNYFQYSQWVEICGLQASFANIKWFLPSYTEQHRKHRWTYLYIIIMVLTL